MVRMRLEDVSVHSANYIPDDHDAWRTRSHSNPNWQIVLAKGRDLRFRRNNEKLILQHGQVLLLQPNEVHSAWGDGPTPSGFYYAQFRPARSVPGAGAPARAGVHARAGSPANAARPTRAGGPANARDRAAAGGAASSDGETGSEGPVKAGVPARRPFALHTEVDLPMYGQVQDERVFTVFADLVAEMQERPPYYRASAAGLCIQLLVLVARHTIPLDTDSKPLYVRSPRQADIVNRLKKFLEFHFRNKLSSGAISYHLGYDYAYLARLFKEATNMTITDYINHLRIEEARVLLLELGEHQSIRDVAEHVGFSDLSYFNRVFRKLEGVSPRAYVRNAYGRVSRSH